MSAPSGAVGAATGEPDDAIERSGALHWPTVPIAGVDEVGRGPLAGPVVAAAVILDPRDVPGGLADSKALGRGAREALARDVHSRALAVAICALPAPLIDATDIRRATLLAMARSVGALALPPARVLVDGRDTIPGLAVPCEPIVKGDARSVSIAAASIVAKVARDAIMRRAGTAWPAYGFERHMGYPVPTHRAAIERHGPCPIHRRSFGTVRRLGAEAEAREAP